MQIDGSLLMPQMNPTNSAATGSHLIQQEGRFQAELDAAHKRLDQATKSGIMTDEQIAQRNQDIKDASIQLEALMLKMLYNDMWKTVPKDELYGDDNAMDIYRDMYHEELTKQMAMDGGIGLADFIYQQLTSTQK
ncbi:MAG: rod-binding protein [Selenomonadaceae bacterium]|nr:rod-binding protein [Selenomonadaceae bacterium]